MFSDRSRLFLSRAGGCTRVYRRREERYAPNCVQEVAKCDDGSVMVWTGIHHGRRTTLVHVVGALTCIIYRDEIMQHHVIPHMNVNDGMFQHDNAISHGARISHVFLRRPNVHFRRIYTQQIIYEMYWTTEYARRYAPPQTLPQHLQALEPEW